MHKQWYRLWPLRGYHYAFWIAVAKEAKARGVRANNYEAIRRICQEVDGSYV